jgi:rhodanese-related sulfurtransferase
MKSSLIINAFLILSIGLQFILGQVWAKDISQEKLLALMQTPDRPLIIDVRTPEEFKDGHIPGAINIPHTLLKDKLGDIESDKANQIILYCRTGRRVGIAQKILAKNNFQQVDHLTGDFKAWRAKNLPENKYKY